MCITHPTTNIPTCNPTVPTYNCSSDSKSSGSGPDPDSELLLAFQILLKSVNVGIKLSPADSVLFKKLNSHLEGLYTRKTRISACRQPSGLGGLLDHFGYQRGGNVIRRGLFDSSNIESAFELFQSS